MLRIIQNQHASGAKNYYSTADYYTEGQELEGVWHGKTAAMLGLSGRIEKSDWDRMCDNIQPRSGDALTARQRADRTVGYDFNFHVPKSVSLLYAMTHDDRLLNAFRDSVEETMTDIESEMQVRIRKNGNNVNRVTGNMAWGTFIHFTARPVDGVPDPHLHAHCFAFNVSWDDAEHQYKAGQFRDLKRDASYFEAMFHSKLAHSLQSMGLPIARTAKGWELDGLEAATLAKFSRRTSMIEALAQEKGIENQAEKSALGAKTRQQKTKELSARELQQVWSSRLSQGEHNAIGRLQGSIGAGIAPRDSTAAQKAVDFSILHSFERQSAVPERTLLAQALRQSVGQATVDEVQNVYQSTPMIRASKNRRTMVTTNEVLKEEQRLIQFAREGRGKHRPLVNGPINLKRTMLNEQQRKAVQHILTSPDRLILLKGGAGVGKTTLMQETVEQIERGGHKILAFAPSADASRGVLREAGFANATTVAQLLLDKSLQAEAAGQMIWIDEAGLLGSKTIAQVIELAERIDARVLLSGDKNQHGSVERGSPLKLLEHEAGIIPAEVKDIKRQSGQYKEAVSFLAEQKTLEGYEILDQLGWVKEIDTQERYQQMAKDYVELTTKGKTALVVSPTHAEGQKITTEIRSQLRQANRLGATDVVLNVLTNAGLTEAERSDPVRIADGDVLLFEQNAKGYKRGDRLEASAGKNLPVELASRYQVFHQREEGFAAGDIIRFTHNGLTIDKQHRLNNGAIYTIGSFDEQGNVVLRENGWKVSKDYGHIAHGYVVTSHASQGKTVDRVLIGQSSESFPASSKEQFYVSVSRGRDQATIYTDNKDMLRSAIQETDDDYSAVDLVANRQRVALYDQVHAKHRQQDRDHAYVR